jgi:hypothetical protein
MGSALFPSSAGRRKASGIAAGAARRSKTVRRAKARRRLLTYLVVSFLSHSLADRRLTGMRALYTLQ